MYLGPAAWRPFNAKLLDGFNFEKGGGLVGGGVLEWGSHCVDLCQWAVGDDIDARSSTTRRRTARSCRDMPNGVELVLRETGWIPLGSCPVRFEGEDRLGRSGRQRQDGAQLARVARRAEGGGDRRLSGDVPRPRLPRLREDAQPAEGRTPTRPATPTSPATRRTSRSHLDRKVKYDPKKHEFIGDEQANRLRSEALREPWRL